jgi:polyhydroxybutyrate depolymerase
MGIQPQPVDAQRASITGWQESTVVQSGNVTRYFRYYVPSNLPKNAAVVILLHGGTQSMRKIFGANSGGTLAWQPLAETEKFLLVVPNGVSETGDTQGDRQNWNDCRPPVASSRTRTTADDVGFIRQLVTWASTQYGIDRRRVYATGASNGGLMSYRLGIELNDQIAAVAAFIANLPAASECRNAARPIPIMMSNGTADPLMPLYVERNQRKLRTEPNGESGYALMR